MAKRPTQADYSKAHGASVRGMQRASFVMRYGIRAIGDAVAAGTLNLHQAERIARLPRDRQLAELNEFLALGSVRKRPAPRVPRSIDSDLQAVAELLNRLSKRWTDDEIIIACDTLRVFSRQLAGEKDINQS